jgi:NAD(P)-dependent dehydrogenase (short-subunit alcohol dehydrogenase family)
MLGGLGYQVALCGRDASKLEEAAGTVEGGVPVPCDVTSRESVEHAVGATVQRFGGLDVAVANAGLFPSRAAIDEITTAEWREVVATNLDGVFHTLAATLPHLRERRGYAFTIGSIYSNHALRLAGPYNASKFGALGLSHTLIQEHEEHGVRATAILPGIVDTAMVPGEKDDHLLLPDDIAKTLAWCLSLSPAALVREVTVERAFVSRVDIELNESPPAWTATRHPSW